MSSCASALRATKRGHVVPQGRAKLAGFLTRLLEGEEGTDLTPPMQTWGA
jgi:hypothetical protein